MKSTHLFFTQGSSNKEYRAEIKQVEGGYLVNFAYGRRGQTLRAGTKTSVPVDLAEAETIYAKLVKSKTSKGYTPDSSGEAYVDTDKSGDVSGVVCQLLNPVASPGRYLRDDKYVAQEKFFGCRQLIQKTKDGVVRAINRKGLYVAVPESIAAAVSGLSCVSCTLDGEGMGNYNQVFDILELDGKDVKGMRYDSRYALLEQLLISAEPGLRLVAMASGEVEKQTLLNGVEARSGEGVVFKRAGAPYSPGRPNSGGDQLKFKLYETCSVIVAKANTGRRSVSVALFDGTPLGNVTIPANANIPADGRIIEVRYLFAYRGGSLYEPVYLEERTDIDPDACVVSQLKFKPEALVA